MVSLFAVAIAPIIRESVLWLVKVFAFFSSLAIEKELVYLPYFCPSLMYKRSKYD